MTRLVPGRAWICILVALVGACDCENQIRKLVSNSGDRRMPPPEREQKTGGLAETEPNDDPSSASPFVLGKELRQIGGSIATSDDVDWYEFSAAATDSVELVVQPDGALDISLHVEVQGGAPLNYDEAQAGGTERVGALKVGPQAQRVVIRPQAGSSGSYTLTFKRRMAADGLEAEPNDDTSVATAFSLPGEVRGTFDRPDDRDVYRLSGDAGKPFDLEIGATEGGRYIARIFDDPKLGTPLLTVQIVDGAVHIPNLALDGAVARWLVLTPLGSPRADDLYRLKATPHPMFEGTLELEPNDARPQAVAFSAPDDTGARKAVVAGYLHAADDRDRFEVTPPPLRARMAPIPPERDHPDYLAPYHRKPRPQVPVRAVLTWGNVQSSFGLRWIGTDGTEVEFRQMTPLAEVVACGLNLEAGPAVLEVRAERLDAAPRTGNPQYTLSVVESSAGESFEAEPNDTSDAADVLETARRGTFAVPDDVDVYAFDVHAPDDGTQKVKVRVSSRGVDLVLKIVDDGGGIIANVDNAAIGSAEFVDVDLPTGLYFAEVRWKGGDLCAPYAIELTR